MSQARQLVTRGTTLLNVSTQSSKEMIVRYGQRDGAYTTARTVGGGTAILEYDFQVQRLNDTVASLLSTTDQRQASSTLLLPLTREDVADTIATAFQHFDSHFPNIPGDRRVTLLVPHNDDDDDLQKESLLTSPKPSLSSNLYCHVEQLPPPSSPPIIVEIRGKPRENPLAKSIDWINQRKELETSIHNSDVHEVVLSSSSTSVDGLPLAQAVEGTQTNVFVVTDGGVVQTAGEGVLEGTIRKLVLEECARQNIPIDISTPPEISNISTFSEMFLTSTSRLVLPVDEIRVPVESEAYAAASRSYPQQQHGANTSSIIHSFKSSSSPLQRPITNRIMRGVNEALINDAVDVISLSKNRLRRDMRAKIRQVEDISEQSRRIAEHLVGMNEFVNANGVGIFLSMSSNELDTGYVLSDLFHSDKYDVGVGGVYGEEEGEGEEEEEEEWKRRRKRKRRKVYVPRVTDYGGKGTMDMLRVGGGWSEICGFKRNRWDIPEPSKQASARMENALRGGSADGSAGGSAELDLDVLIVPCVAYDKIGRRCGHGGGFYDRFIEELQEIRERAGQKKAILIGVALDEQCARNERLRHFNGAMGWFRV